MENKTPVKVDPKVIDEKKREREKLLSEKKIVKKQLR